MESLEVEGDLIEVAVELQSGTPDPSEQSALAHAMSALFLGLQLLDRLDPDDASNDEVYGALGQAGEMFARLMSAFPAKS